MPAGRFRVPTKPKPKRQAAPVEVTTDANRPQKRQPKPVRPPAGIQGPVAPPKPDLPPRREPPVPILQQYGFNGTLDEFSHRLNMATVTHEQTFGYKPAPGLAFDLARSDIPEDKFTDMFAVPKLGKKQQEASGLVPAGSLGMSTVDLETQKNEYTNQLLKEAYAANKNPENWSDFMDKRWQDVERLKREDENFAWRFQNVITKGIQESSQNQKVYSAALGGSAYFRAGFIPLNVGARGVKQVYGSLLLSPQAILVDIPKATAADGMDFRTAAAHAVGKELPGTKGKKGSFRPKRIEAMGDAIAKDYVRRYSGYFTHPGRIADDPGFIFMDVLGLATVFGGAAGRLAAVRSVAGARAAGFEAAKTFDNPALMQWEQEFRPIVQKTAAAEKTGPVEPGLSDLLNNKHEPYIPPSKISPTPEKLPAPSAQELKKAPSKEARKLMRKERYKSSVPDHHIEKVNEGTYLTQNGATKKVQPGDHVYNLVDSKTGKTNGSITYTVEDGATYVHQLYVRPSIRNSGAFRELLSFASQHGNPLDGLPSSSKLGRVVQKINKRIESSNKPERSAVTGKAKPRWEKYSELRGYTPTQISEYHTYLNMIKQGERLGLPASDIRDIIQSARAGETGLHTQVSEIPSRADYLRAAIQRPRAGVHEMRIGQASTYYPLSENYFVAQMQQYFPEVGLRAQQRRADIRWAEDSPGGDMLPVEALHGGMYDNAKAFFHKHFSYEAKFNRRKNVEGRYTELTQMAPKRELERAIGRAMKKSEVFASFPDKLRVRLSRAENKAIEVLATDAYTVDEALQSHIDFHTDMIKNEEGYTAAHERQLEDLKGAKAVLDAYKAGKASKRFKEAYRLTQEVTARQQALKIDELGLLPETAAARPVIHGMALRGETFVPGKEQILKNLSADIDVREEYRKSLIDPDGNPKPGVKEELKKIDKDIGDMKRAIINMLVPEQRNPDAFYFKSERVARAKKKDYQRGTGTVNVGEFGVTLPASMQELNHFFTATAMRAGDTRIDIPMLAAESFGRTIRHVSVKNAWDQLWKAGRPANKPKLGFIPIRNVRNISPELRNVFTKIDQGTFDAKQAERLDQDTQKILSELFPDPNGSDFQELLRKEEVRWVDPAIVGELNKKVPLADTSLGPVMRAIDTINDPFRFAFLYARPAYLLNYLSNAGMATFHQGVHWGRTLPKAYMAQKLYGAKAADTLRVLVGEGRTKSYFAPEGGLSKLTGPVARAWSKVTDEHWRMSALIRELEREKFDIKKLNHDLSTEDMRTVNIAAERANKAMVQFDNLLPFEKEVLRHIIFVYPWQSRAAVWSLRTVIAHPIKTNALVELGKMVDESRDDTFLKYAPEWFKKAGYMVVGFAKDGTPYVANPTTINTFATLSQEMDVIDSFLGPTPFSSGEDILGPTIKFGIHAVTGKDEFGNDYPDGNIVGAFKELFLTLPQLRAAHQKPKDNLPPVTGVDKVWGQMSDKEKAQWTTSQAGGAADIHILEKRERAALKLATLSPAWQSTAANFFSSWSLGGMSPKLYDQQAAISRYWKAQGWEKQFAHSVDLQRKALKMQSEVVGRSVPKAVRDAVEFSFVRTKAYRVWQKANGREPNMQVKNQIDIELFQKEGKLNEKQAAALTRELKAVVDTGDADTLRAKLNKIAGAEVYIDWDRNVRMVASFHNATINRDTAVLKNLGLGDYKPQNLSENEYEEVGRKYLDWSIADKKKRDEIAGTDDKYDKDVLSAKYRVWLQQQGPIGEGLPSAPEFATARLAGAGNKLTTAIRSRMFESWAKVGSRDRALLGKPTDPKMLRAWELYFEAVNKYRKNNPPGKRGIEQVQRDLLAAQIAKIPEFKGFGNDYNFAKQRLYKRFQSFNAFKQSKNKAAWKVVFDGAEAFSKAIDANGSETYYKEAWKDTMIRLEPLLASDYPGWEKELKEIQKTKPTFLASLLAKGSVS